MAMKKARRWAFTWFQYEDENVTYLRQIEESKCDYLVVGFEICPETQKPHLQGYIEFKSPITMMNAKSRLDPNMKKKSKVHIESAWEDREKNIRYCKKDESKNPEAEEKWFEVIHKEKKQGERTDWHKMHDFIKDEPDFKKFAEEFPETAIKYHAGVDRLIRATIQTQQLEDFKEQFNDVQLQEWQAQLTNSLLREPDDRTIRWVYDIKGGKGKTWLSKYLVAKHGAARFENGAGKDIAHAYEGEPIVIFDFSRCTEERVNYGIIEAIKNGIMFAPKYNSCCKYFKSPHVVCFANWEPNRGAMSQDRWYITNLDKPEENPIDIGGKQARNTDIGGLATLGQES